MAKHKVKNAVAFISRFEEIVAHEAERRHVDGVVCGHIHTAEIRQFGSVTYYNDGDWVEGCTALVEHHDGTMEILHWGEEMAARQRARPSAPASPWIWRPERAAEGQSVRIVIVTDAWSPQINGVVRTLQSVRAELHCHGP